MERTSRTMTRRTALACFAAFGASIAGLGLAASARADEAAEEETLVGRITAIDGSTVELALGELADGGAAGGMGDMEGDPGAQGGDEDGGETPPEATEGEQPADDQGADQDGGETPPDISEGEQPADGDAGQGGFAGGSSFTENGETATVDLSGATVSTQGSEGETEGSVDDLAVGDILSIVLNDDGSAASVTVVTDGMGGGQPEGQSGFGGSGEVTQGTAATTIDTDGTYTGETYTSTGDDENALRVDGATVTLDGITVDKSAGSSSNTEDGDFYGLNAALLATNGAQVTIVGATVTSSAQNGNGIFSYGEDTRVEVSDTVITTTADNSGGIQTTGGGTTVASNLTIETSGSSSAAIRSDRGGGTVEVDGGDYTTNGYNSPAVYSTATVSVANATLIANNSEALVIEGQNSIALTDCIVSGNMSDTEGTSSDENVHNVMIYQSMSGDAEVGTSVFSMTGGSLTSNNGDVFFVTNTHCTVALSGVEIVNEDSEGCLIRISGNSASRGWGSAGSNGGQMELTLSGQTLEGDIVVDSISTLTMELADGSSFTGTVTIVDNEQGGTAVDDNVVVTVGSGCTWTLTGDCSATSVDGDGTIEYGGYTITLADGSVLSA